MIYAIPQRDPDTMHELEILRFVSSEPYYRMRILATRSPEVMNYLITEARRDMKTLWDRREKKRQLDGVL